MRARSLSDAEGLEKYPPRVEDWHLAEAGQVEEDFQIPRAPWPCWQHRRVVLFGEGSEGRIQRRLEPKSRGDRGFEIVADRRLRHAAEVLKARWFASIQSDGF